MIDERSSSSNLSTMNFQTGIEGSGFDPHLGLRSRCCEVKASRMFI